MVIISDNKRDFHYTRMVQKSYAEMKDAHYHPYTELYYLIAGKRKFFIDDTLFTLNPGDLILIPKGSVHRTTYVSNEVHERVAMSFSDEFIAPVIEDMGDLNYNKLFHNYLIQIPAGQRDYIEQLFGKMGEELTSNDALAKSMIKAHIMELLIFLLRSKEHLVNPEIASETDDETISAAARYISNHYAEDLTLNALAEKFSISPTYFSKKFKQQTGFGYKEYLSLVRSMAARHLLEDTTLPITEIAGMCGFESSNYFGDAFKKSLGMSPRDYRKLHSVV